MDTQKRPWLSPGRAGLRQLTCIAISVILHLVIVTQLVTDVAGNPGTSQSSPSCCFSLICSFFSSANSSVLHLCFSWRAAMVRPCSLFGADRGDSNAAPPFSKNCFRPT
jgi:hypothetical protein